jgi:hypothetical protein
MPTSRAVVHPNMHAEFGQQYLDHHLPTHYVKYVSIGSLWPGWVYHLLMMFWILEDAIKE